MHKGAPSGDEKKSFNLLGNPARAQQACERRYILCALDGSIHFDQCNTKRRFSTQRYTKQSSSVKITFYEQKHAAFKDKSIIFKGHRRAIYGNRAWLHGNIHAHLYMHVVIMTSSVKNRDLLLTRISDNSNFLSIPQRFELSRFYCTCNIMHACGFFQLCDKNDWKRILHRK